MVLQVIQSVVTLGVPEYHHFLQIQQFGNQVYCIPYFLQIDEAAFVVDMREYKCLTTVGYGDAPQRVSLCRRALHDDVGPCKTEHYDLSPVIANEMQLESVAPSHRPLPVSGQSGEYLVGIPAQVVAYGYHGGVYEGDASAPPEGVEVQEEHHLEEHPALQFHKAVVGHRIRKVTLEMDTDEVQVVVLEIVDMQLSYPELT